MDNREKDPDRCSALRQIDRDTDRRLEENSRLKRAAWQEIETIRSRLRQLRDRLFNLQRVKSALDMTSGLPPVRGIAAGVSAATVEVRIATVEAQIAAAVTRLGNAERTRDKLEDDRQRLQHDQSTLGTEMTMLNCVRDFS